MTDIVAEIRAVQQQAKEAAAKAAKADAAREHAEEQITALTAELAQFTVGTWAEAQERFEELKKEAADAVAEAQKILNGDTE